MKRLIFALSGAFATLAANPALALYEQARWFTLDNGMDVIVIEIVSFVGFDLQRKLAVPSCLWQGSCAVSVDTVQ